MFGWLLDFLSLFFPGTCLLCGGILGRQERLICMVCDFHLPRTNFHTAKDNPLSRAFWGRADIEAATACFYFSKGGKVQQLLHHLKYKGNKEVGLVIGEQYGHILKEAELFEDVDVIIAVPLHQSRQKERGYNQSQLFAMGLSRSMGARLDETALYRKMATESQTRKSRYKRWENVREIFALRNSRELEGKHILLVDDVITTGATIEACVNELRTIPGVRVSVGAIACLAR
jgi:ComF family protein